MILARPMFAVAACFAFATVVHAQTVNLTEETYPGDCSKYQLDLALNGNLILNQEGQKETLRLEARARHQFTERTLSVEGALPRKSARHYDQAEARVATGPNALDRSLAADHRLIVVDRRPDGVQSFCSAGPLTREELDTVAEHFHPHALPGLLPGKPVKVGDTWNVDAAAVQAACLFDGIVKHELTGKLVSADKGRAAFTIEGTAEGIETSAPVKLTVSATGIFDLNSKRIIELNWKQKDERGDGPVSPASAVEATIRLRREVIGFAPAELSDAVVRGLPREAVTDLRYTDPKGEFQFVYSRNWHITGQTDSALVLRLIDRGELIAQVTLTRWRKADEGKHATPDEFKKMVSELPGWAAKEIIEDSEVRVDGGRWLYRLAANGEVNGLPVMQVFHLLAGPQGHQLAATVAMKPEKMKVVGPRDLALVKAIEFTAKK